MAAQARPGLALEREDRQKVRIIPSTLARAGYQIAKANGSR